MAIKFNLQTQIGAKYFNVRYIEGYLWTMDSEFNFKNIVYM